MRLEVATHRRAETVGLIDVGLIGERDGAAEPGVARPFEPAAYWDVGNGKAS